MDKKILLNANKDSWAISVNHGTNTDKKLLKIGKQILARDNYSCFYCSLRSKSFQEVHHLDGNHKNNDLSNLTTICPICHQNFHLVSASTTGGGKIIWLPEITQIELNNLCKFIFVLFHKEGELGVLAGVARSLYHALDERGNLIESQFAIGSSDPGTFAQSIIRINSSNGKIKETVIEDFKMLPAYPRFQSAVDFWSKIIFKKLPYSQWSNLIDTNIDLTQLYEELQVD